MPSNSNRAFKNSGNQTPRRSQSNKHTSSRAPSRAQSQRQSRREDAPSRRSSTSSTHSNITKLPSFSQSPYRESFREDQTPHPSHSIPRKPLPTKEKSSNPPNPSSSKDTPSKPPLSRRLTQKAKSILKSAKEAPAKLVRSLSLPVQQAYYEERGKRTLWTRKDDFMKKIQKDTVELLKERDAEMRRESERRQEEVLRWGEENAPGSPDGKGKGRIGYR